VVSVYDWAEIAIIEKSIFCFPFKFEAAWWFLFLITKNRHLFLLSVIYCVII
jgi:hypothetical protein